MVKIILRRLKAIPTKILYSYIKKLSFFLLIGITFACIPIRKSSSYIHEDQLCSTRRYIGNYIDYYHTEPGISGGRNLIWIRTTQFNSYGKISAYGKTCDFSVGDKIYLRRTSTIPDSFGNWSFQIENDSSVYYMVSGYRYENNAIVLASF